jgi:hypothetical protein
MALYNNGIFVLTADGSGGIWDDPASAYQILLLDTTYVFDRDHFRVSDISASEIATTNYTRQAVANRTITVDNANDRVIYDCDNNAWPDLGPAAGGPVVGSSVHFVNTGDDGTSGTVNHLDFVDTQVNGGDFTVQYAATGAILATSPS